MTKALDDYMNDPDIAHYPMPLREIYAVRPELQDEHKGLTDAERKALIHQRAMEFLHRAEDRKSQICGAWRSNGV